MPVSVVVQFWLPRIAVTFLDPTGEAASTPEICALIAGVSVMVKGLALLPALLAPCAWPGVMISRLLPSRPMSETTLSVAPVPIVTMVMTAATPMTTPRMVRIDRMVLRRIARKARRTVSQIMP